MNIAAKFRERQLANGSAPFPQAILTVAMDQHNVHCMTEGMLDEWFRSLPAAEKAVIFDAHLGAPDLPSAASLRPGLARPSGATGLVALNAATVGLPTLGTPAVVEVQANDLGRRNEAPALRTLLRQSLDQLGQVDAPTPHASSVRLGPVEVLR